MWPVLREAQKSLQTLLTSHEVWAKGLPFLFVALSLSFWNELFSLGSRYNSMLLLAALAVSTIQFTPDVTRHYFIYLALIALSLLIDLKSFLSDTNSSSLYFYAVNLSKALTIRNILYYSATARRIRKYLHRLGLPHSMS
jgi:hypothetical protein